LLLAVTFVFFISLSASYASNVSDNIPDKNYNVVEELANDLEGYINKEINIANQAESVNYNDSQSGFLASGEEDRPTKLSQSSIINASKKVDKFISQNGQLPNFVTINNYKFSMPEFMYLLSKTIEYKYKKSNSQVTIKYDVKNPTKPTGNNIKGTVSSKDYYNYTKRVANFIAKHNTAPNFVSVRLGNMQYQATIQSFVKILCGIKNDKLPTSISLNVNKESKINKHFPKYLRPDPNFNKPLNDPYTNESLEMYLRATKNCQVDDDLIKSLAINITKNSRTNLQKANAIFNWVKNQINYVFYYNTKYGAKTTLSNRLGNCVDQTHLFIALSRASGIPARYVNGKCTFISGSTIGHVWAQILVNNVWTVADTTNSRNSLGVINSWNSYKLYGKYDEITF